jgi:hypothetical protein
VLSSIESVDSVKAEIVDIFDVIKDVLIVGLAIFVVSIVVDSVEICPV